MDEGTKDVTVADIIDAMERNGYKMARENWVVMNKAETKVLRACALGQAAVNLGIDWKSLALELPHTLKFFIIDLNDSKRLSCEEIAARVRKSGMFKPMMDKVLHLAKRNYNG